MKTKIWILLIGVMAVLGSYGLFANEKKSNSSSPELIRHL